MPDSIMIGELFTVSELDDAARLYRECRPGEFNKRVVVEIIEPALSRINETTGQENDACYLGYALEYLLMRRRR